MPKRKNFNPSGSTLGCACDMCVLLPAKDGYKRIGTDTKYYQFLVDMPRTSEWLTYREIAERMDVEPQDASSQLTSLNERGAVDTDHDDYPKKYRISERGIQALIIGDEL